MKLDRAEWSMSVSGRGGEIGSELLGRDVLSDEEITVFPDSAAVLDLGNKSTNAAVVRDDGGVEPDGLTFYGDREGDGTRSLLFATWRRTEAVCYFATVIVLLVILAFCVYFVFVMFVIRRNSSKSSESGVRWTRLRQR